jgi:hypothetical protein
MAHLAGKRNAETPARGVLSAAGCLYLSTE